MRRRINSSLTLVALLLCLAPVGCAQEARPRVARDEALKSVKVASLEGWKEAVSDAGRFRILFHGEPEVADESGGNGFEMKGDRVKWFALYYDYKNVEEVNDATLRQRLKESVDAVAARRGAKLLSRSELTLNGRPGVEFILLEREAKSYMRSFQVGLRLYILAVDDYKELSEATAVPPDARNFFDSFTFWE